MNSNNGIFQFVAVLVLFNLVSCQNEKIESEHPVRTSTEQQKSSDQTRSNSKGPKVSSIKNVPEESYNREDKVYTIRGTYNLDKIEINRPIKNGTKIIQGIGNLIADFIVRIGGDFDVSMDPIPLDVSDIDKDIVKRAVVKKIRIEAVDKNRKTKLNFLKNLKLYLLKPGKEKIKVSLIDSTYEKSVKDDVCNKHCLDINVNGVNLIDYIGDTKEIIFEPQIEIGKIPKSNFEIKISLDFEVGIKMPL